ncbi:MAG: Chaperone protein DnaJ [Alphaproteobacteria bacterium MarineAlpha5_Bin11]|nr:molecular chaperone DnaJ [Pelagibacteraceae bacterium]PPR44527.1 MAG: Chaperone protein DnaJ [Alphaproteobacteria bacterium MarineAlpha5_Bin11]PPR52038.1 MAG: Chaperone protein DnaJ [Alphaproteobacteria bacterium MarineAlpha5_Bin10]|tara:strand:- start:2574 stop:3164 length:591 start_codon:yes stop_codon:yes gene_type:complete
MRKIRPEIKNKKFSWENEDLFNICDAEECLLEGKYKAPKSKMNLRDYYLFCLKHVKEYNKSWDYYKDMSADQVEFFTRADTIWNRPTWPVGGHYNKIYKILHRVFGPDYGFFMKNSGSQNKWGYRNFSEEEKKSLKKLNINAPITLEKIKSSYKKLVKKYHPDINKNDKNAEIKIKEINASYRLLLKKFSNKNTKL